MAWLLLLVACFPDPEPGAEDPCVACHGSPETGPAPPAALGGSTNPASLAVGAHQAHVLAPITGSPVACSECHTWPDSVDAVGHIDTPWPAEVPWGDVAKAGGVATPWDREAATCTVWCHGVGLVGGADGAETTPSWTDPDGSASQCGACHGIPPAPPHVQSGACEACHGPLTGETHIDGKTTCSTAGTTDGTSGATATNGTDTGGHPEGNCNVCSACHGATKDGAPPPDTLGNTDTAARGVGAHAAHLAVTDTAVPIGCWACHTELLAMDQAGHINGSVEVVFGASVTGMHGVTAVWDPVGLTCTVGCHLAVQPVWNEVVGGEVACELCHGNPPPPPHPGISACESCHPARSATTHMDGFVDF